MLMGFYDLNGYQGCDLIFLIDGMIDADSREDENSLLNRFIASESYYERFFSTTPEDEFQWTFTDDLQLNSGEWNSLSDWLGTGQYWRNAADYSTSYQYGSLKEISESSATYTLNGNVLPVKFADFSLKFFFY